MRLNWTGYQYKTTDGYGRYGAYMIQALMRAGVDVSPLFEEAINMPTWMQEMTGATFEGRLTISCLPPYFVQKIENGRHWLLTMTEGSELPLGWRDAINNSGVELVIVPCEHNAQAFRNGGVTAPVYVVPGGTDPDEFALRNTERDADKPYTFLALADRGDRKGWVEVYAAFYKAFGSATDTPNVRLILKSLKGSNPLLEMIAGADNLDPRLVFQMENVPNARDVYAQADCVALPSRSEGWGMPHREAAMLGVPVITQAYSGMDDGNTHEWAIVVDKGRMQAIPSAFDDHLLGKYRVADVDELASAMSRCYRHPKTAVAQGRYAARWLRANQTWDHAAAKLIDLLKEQGAWH